MSAPLTAAEYRVILHRLGLDAVTAARLPGIGKTDAKRYGAGTLAVPDDVAKLLRDLVRSGISPEELAEQLDG